MLCLPSTRVEDQASDVLCLPSTRVEDRASKHIGRRASAGKRNTAAHLEGAELARVDHLAEGLEEDVELVVHELDFDLLRVVELLERLQRLGGLGGGVVAGAGDV